LSEDAALDERRQWVDCPALAFGPPIVAAVWTGRHGLALALFMIARQPTSSTALPPAAFGLQEPPFGAYLPDPPTNAC